MRRTHAECGEVLLERLFGLVMHGQAWITGAQFFEQCEFGIHRLCTHRYQHLQGVKAATIDLVVAQVMQNHPT